MWSRNVESPQGAAAATTDSPGAAPDGNANGGPGADSAPAAKDAGEQKRIDELTGNWRAAERNAEYWRGRAEAGQGQGKQSDGKQEQRTDQPAAEPKKTLKDFGYDEALFSDYLEERAAKAARREVDGLRTEIREGQTKAERESQMDDFAERAEKWATTNKVDKPDLMWAKPEDGGPYVSNHMADAMLDSEHGPEILNYLTRNREEGRRICRLPAMQQARAIGRLEAKFAAGPAARTDSGAPPPAAQVRGASETAGAKKDAADMTDAEWYADKQRRDKAAKKK